jgi:hypothetical protein
MVIKVLNNKQQLYWLMQTGGWATYALVQIVASVIASASGTISVQRIVFLTYEAFFCFLITHAYRYFINRWRWLSLGMPLLIPRVLLSVFVLGLIMYFVRIPATISLDMFNQRILFDPMNIIGQSFYYSILFFLWSVFYFIYNYFERYNKSLKMEASIKEIELNNLKSQLNPHFIFNALNSIRALVDENPEKSKMAINQLSNILRNSLVADKRGLTKFGDELKIVKDYLGLESIRFEERLRTDFDVDASSKSFLVPPLMVQTLVENGVKHGISKLTEGGLIQVIAKVDHNHLKITIRNSGQYHINGHKKRAGLGLSNTAQRLKLLYGEDAHFEIKNENDSFVRTEITIPYLTNS